MISPKIIINIVKLIGDYALVIKLINNITIPNLLFSII